MCTWAVLIQFLMVLVVGLATQSKVELDADGTPIWSSEMAIVQYIALALKWITFIFLYGGMIAVVVGVYTMTPETANGRGSVPLIGDGKVPGVDAKVPLYNGVKEPYGASDLPGVKREYTGSPSAGGSPGL